MLQPLKMLARSSSTSTATQVGRRHRFVTKEIMSDLVVIAFPTEAKAEEVRQKILDLQKDYLIELGDAAIAVKQPDGSVRLNQLINTTAAGAVSGTFWGTLIGLNFLVPLAGAAIGAASGALGGWLTDVGVNDAFMKDVAESLQPGNAALFLLIRKLTTDKVLDDLKGVGGKVLRTSFDHTKEEALRAALAGVSQAVQPPAPDQEDLARAPRSCTRPARARGPIWANALRSGASEISIKP